MNVGQTDDSSHRRGWTTVPGVEVDERPGHLYLSDAGLKKSIDGAKPVAIGAVCGLRNATAATQAHSLHFWVCEFIELDSGEKLALNDSRGFTFGHPQLHPRINDQGFSMSRELFVRTIEAVVSPNPSDLDSDAPRRIARLALARGVSVEERDLRVLRYQVILTGEVLAWLADT